MKEDYDSGAKSNPVLAHVSFTFCCCPRFHDTRLMRLDGSNGGGCKKLASSAKTQKLNVISSS